MSKPMDSVFDTGARPKMICKSFLLVKRREGIRPIHRMSFKSASNSPVNVIQKIMHCVHEGDLHVCVYFVVVDNVDVPLQIGLSFIDGVFKGIFRMERQTIPFQSLPVATLSQCTPASDPCLSCSIERFDRWDEN